MPGAFNVGPFPLAAPKNYAQRSKTAYTNADLWRTIVDRIEGDTGRGLWDLTQLIVRCVATAALLTTAAWLVINYVLDSLFR